MATEEFVEGLDEFIEQLDFAAKRAFKKKMKEWNDAIAFEFLRIVQDEIKLKQIVRTRLLLNSFQRGNVNNLWSYNNSAKTELEVGTNLKYASYVNDGHYLNPHGQAVRFVPGYWKNSEEFVYERGHEGGMTLKQRWIEGYHFWEKSLFAIERIALRSMEIKMQEWIDEFFG